MSQNKSPITTHILDTTMGLPAANIAVELYYRLNTNQIWQLLGEGQTDDDGRIDDLFFPKNPLSKGFYKIQFSTAEYFEKDNRDFFYPFVEITFFCKGDRDHYHVPLLISPYSYSTYRGS